MGMREGGGREKEKERERERIRKFGLRKLMYTKKLICPSHVLATIKFIEINCQIRSCFCQFGCEVIVVPYETGGRTIQRCHAYLRSPSLRSKPQTRGASSPPTPLYQAYWLMQVHSGGLALRATDELGHHCMCGRFWQVPLEGQDVIS